MNRDDRLSLLAEPDIEAKKTQIRPGGFALLIS
jgi:hypothetical protein